MRELRTTTVCLGFARHRFVLAVLGVLLLSSVAFPGRPERNVAQPARSKLDLLSACITGCNSGDCLWACIAEKPREEGTYAVAGETSIIDCFLEGFGDVGTCADVFLGEDPDPEGYWVCVGGAGSKFLRCTGLASATSSVMRPVNDKRALRVILLVAEARYQASLVPNGQSEHGPNRETQPWAVYPPDAETAEGGVAATSGFKACATNLKDDRGTCSDIFGDDPEGQSVCNEGAKMVFTSCLRALS